MHKKLDNHLLSKVVLLSALTVTSLSAGNAGAAVLVNVTESNGNVIFQGSGSLNTTGLTSNSGNGTPLVRPFTGEFTFGPAISPNWFQYFATPITGPQVFGTRGSAYPTTGADYLVASSASGDAFGISPGNGFFFVPTNYISGASLNGTLTFNNQTFATMGLTSGNTYTWTYGTGSNADSFTLNVSQAVPELLTILGAGVAVVFGAVFKNKSSRKSEE
jgi:hypothetical protein